MKNIIQFLGLFILGFVLFSCNDDEAVAYTSQSAARNDAVLIVYTPVISFVAGEPGYDLSLVASNSSGSTEVSDVVAYKTYTDSKTGETSDEVVHATYSMGGQSTMIFEEFLTFAQLRDGLTIGGGPLPTDELEIPIGSKWNFRFEMVNSGGSEIASKGGSERASIAVLSPFAGNYMSVTGKYFRIGEESSLSNWSGNVKFIGSVDDNTFAYTDAWGPFTAQDGAVGEMLFDLNDDNSITILDDPSQLFFSGNDMLTCHEDAALFVNVPCAGSDILTPSGDGKHNIKLTFGYFTTGSGAREFYEELEKVVE